MLETTLKKQSAVENQKKKQDSQFAFDLKDDLLPIMIGIMLVSRQDSKNDFQRLLMKILVSIEYDVSNWYVIRSPILVGIIESSYPKVYEHGKVKDLIGRVMGAYTSISKH